MCVCVCMYMYMYVCTWKIYTFNSNRTLQATTSAKVRKVGVSKGYSKNFGIEKNRDVNYNSAQFSCGVELFLLKSEI